MRRSIWAVWGLVGALSLGCEEDDKPPVDAGRLDAGRLDAGDLGLDASLDAGPDAGTDAGRDSGPDAGKDAGPDAGRDASPDAGRDASPDASPDAGPDASLDSGPDASLDSGLDSGPDAAPDAGPVDPCAAFDCQPGRCAVEGEAAVCLCPPSFEAVGRGCAPLLPVLENLPADVFGSVGEAGEYALRVSPEGLALSYRVPPDACPFAVSVDDEGLVTWRCPDERVSCEVAVSVEHQGQVSEGALTLICANAAPVFLGALAERATEHLPYAFEARCVDPEGFPVEVAVAEDDDCGGVLEGEIYGFLPDEGDGGTTCFAHLICDDGELRRQLSATIAIAETNAAPAFEGAPYATSAVWGRTGRVAASATDADLPAQALAFSLASTDCAFPVTVSAAGVVDYTCGAPGSCEATLRVSDGTARAEAPLSLTCTNAAPVYSAAIQVAATEHAPLAYVPSCTDADGDAVAVSLVEDTCGGALAGDSFSFTPSEAAGGATCEATFRCDDGQAQVDTRVAFGIAETNEAPAFDGAPYAGSAAWGRTGQLAAAATDGDLPAQALTFSLASTDCAFPVAVSAAGVVDYTCGAPGSCEAILSVSDGQTAVQAPLSLTCTNAAPRALDVAVHPDVAYNDTALTCAYTFDDADGDPDLSTITWLVNDAPLADPTGAFGPGDRVRCRVTPHDGVAAGEAVTSAERTIANRAPVVGNAAITPDPIPMGGGPLDCQYDFSDADGDGDQSLVEWLVGGVVVGAGQGFSQYAPGDQLSCRVTPHDGRDAGEVVTSAALVAPVPVTAASAGDQHLCAIKGGALYCWGANSYGQLGDGTTTARHTPALVLGMERGVTAVSAGGQQTCAIQEGALKCWGANVVGDPGDDTSFIRVSTPVAIAGLDSGVTAVSAGHMHTCVLHNGAAKCWGTNYAGQLGEGSLTSRTTPTAVMNLETGVSALAAGYSHTCAIHNGTAKCWGRNNLGQLGVSDRTSLSVQPITVPGLELGVSLIAAGDHHTCVLHNGVTKCWGANERQQLGKAGVTASSSYYPVTVTGLEAGVTALTGGFQHTCAIHNGVLKCWGGNYYGQLGDDQDATSSTSRLATAVSGLESGISGLTAGGYFTCAIHSGLLKCWGLNFEGQLGRTAMSRSPTLVSEGVWSQPFAGYSHTCALHNGALKCWGFYRGVLPGGDGFGQSGDGTMVNRTLPTPVVGLGSGVTGGCAGENHVCAIHEGALKCWGDNSNYQLGDGTIVQRLSPVVVPGLGSGVTAVAAERVRTCAIQDGAVKCWGSAVVVPTTMTGLESGTTALAVGPGYGCAIQDGALKCWGKNTYGQLGDGTKTDRVDPVAVAGLGSGVTAVAVGIDHTCAIHEGALKCWGSNRSGQLGDGTNTAHLTPELVAGLESGVTGVGTGSYHTCALQEGAVRCWGMQSGGGESNLPVSVFGLESGVSALVAGQYHTCALQNQALICWGDLRSGQLGVIGPFSYEPLLIPLP